MENSRKIVENRNYKVIRNKLVENSRNSKYKIIIFFEKFYISVFLS